MADDTVGTGRLSETSENEALRGVLAAEHTAVWGYGVVGAALGPDGRAPAVASELVHRDARDQLVTLLDERGVDPPRAEGGYALPFPVLSAVDAAALAVVLEEGVAAAWVRVLDQSVEPATRELAVDALGATELRALSWRGPAGRSPLTRPFPGLPES